MMCPRSKGILPLKLFADRLLQQQDVKCNSKHWVALYLVQKALQVSQAPKIPKTRWDRSIQAIAVDIAAKQDSVHNTHQTHALDAWEK